MNDYFRMKSIVLIVFCVGILHYSEASSSVDTTLADSDSEKVIEWNMAQILDSHYPDWTIIGTPAIVDCPYGKAVYFGGQKDAMVFNANILRGLHQFTVEVMMRPDTNGQREQRFIHIGEIRGERVMVETRLTMENQWYLDTYMKSGDSGKTLVDSTHLHLLNQWYHVAFVVKNGTMEAYVNGERELEGWIPFSPFTAGETSVGVRLNRVNWFKGAIYKLKISPAALSPKSFLNINP